MDEPELLNLFNITLPDKCAVDAQLAFLRCSAGHQHLRVRFTALRPRKFLPFLHKKSKPSGWFDYDPAEPIELEWDAFWPVR